jgi:hypothetical protein
MRLLFDQHEQFKNVAAGVQSIILTIAVVVGGGWALFTFISLRQSERAAADVAAQNRANRGQVALSFAVSAKQYDAEMTRHNAAAVIEASVAIQNVGNRDVILCFDGNPQIVPLSFIRLSPDAATLPEHSKPSSGLITAEPIDSVFFNRHVWRVRVGSTIRHLFLTQLPRPGVYFVEYQTKGVIAENSDDQERCTNAKGVWREGVLFSVN